MGHAWTFEGPANRQAHTYSPSVPQQAAVVVLSALSCLSTHTLWNSRIGEIPLFPKVWVREGCGASSGFNPADRVKQLKRNLIPVG
jgi:hypothetical protein